MANMQKRQLQSFEERIGRIRTGDSVNLSGELHIGPREEVRAKDARAQKKELAKRKRKALRAAHSPVGQMSSGDLMLFPVALLVGALAFLAGRLTAFHFLTPDGMFPIDTSAFLPPTMPVALWGDLVLAVAFVLIFAWMFHLTRGLRRLGVLLGFAAMMPGETLLVERYPDLAAMAYSPGFVTEALARPSPVEWPQGTIQLSMPTGIF